MRTIANTFILLVRRLLSKELWIHIARSIYLFSTFFILLLLFVGGKLLSKVLFVPVLGKILLKLNFPTGKTIMHYEELLSLKIDNMRTSEVKRSYLIGLAFKNLLSKKTRSFITILGMSVGIGIIVLLLSLGYGIERLVISRIASLNELRMVDVSSSENTALRLDRSAYNKIANFSAVEKVIPLVSTVGKITINKATTDVLVYAAPRDYLNALNTRVLRGKLYDDNHSFDKPKAQRAEDGSVAGVSTQLEIGELGVKRSTYEFNIDILPSRHVPVWEVCDVGSKVLGFTTRFEGGTRGVAKWGSQYSPFDEFGKAAYDGTRNIYLGKWVQAEFPLYQQSSESGFDPQLSDTGIHLWKTGCVQEKDIQKTPVLQTVQASVLGEATASADVDEAVSLYDAVVVSSDSSGIEMVMLQSSASATTKQTTDKLVFSSLPSGQAVISSGLASLLGVPVDKAVGREFTASFIIGKSLMPTIEGKSYSEDTTYKIIGVLDDDNNTYFYVPYTDMKKLNVPHVSQMKIILTDSSLMPKVRKGIETLGFRTNSTIDTVKQIESLFNNLRIVLAVLGLVALGVASLGMFNTLTVSLLERTREIGGMKTMGMVSEEVQDLFLAEAMIMGLAGGFGGLLLGSMVGKGLSLLISAIALSQGQGFIDLTYIPLPFSTFIVVSSFIVGVLTGIYPAQRAKKISALNALRYE